MDNVPIFHLKTTLRNLDKPRSTIPIKAVKIPVTVITKIVEANNSFRVDQETLLNSLRTSLKKFIGFAKIFTLLGTPVFYPAILFVTGQIFFHKNRSCSLKTTGAAGLEPAVTVLETVGLPLTDAPNII